MKIIKMAAFWEIAPFSLVEVNDANNSFYIGKSLRVYRPKT
jgi:hypothetical protein